MDQAKNGRKYYQTVKSIQDEEFESIQQSCGEHAIISLATAYETYYKELLQQLLADFPDYFLSIATDYTPTVVKLLQDPDLLTYENIEAQLKLKSRFDYYQFFQTYSIPFLTPEERSFIEYIYLRRNNYVHSAGRVDAKTEEKLRSTPPPYDEPLISTEAKRLRTKLNRMVQKLDRRVIAFMHQAYDVASEKLSDRLSS